MGWGCVDVLRCSTWRSVTLQLTRPDNRPTPGPGPRAWTPGLDLGPGPRAWTPGLDPGPGPRAWTPGLDLGPGPRWQRSLSTCKLTPYAEHFMSVKDAVASEHLSNQLSATR
ncbi:hypothetical protein VZT92_003550 [Zoarces viviparus]|uniref:Uncharacterized protein n=1 Tax=Zoarces viviparus TaxID=48416 RepID=A0AAW1FW62_ZOAVI